MFILWYGRVLLQTAAQVGKTVSLSFVKLWRLFNTIWNILLLFIGVYPKQIARAPVTNKTQICI